jgi:lipoprotein-anchoring transpeptidase ErfK/SrfK
VRAARAGGRWIGVVSPVGPAGRLGWIDRRRTRVRMFRTTLSLRADLSERMLELRDAGRVRRRIPVTIGSPATPTPTGRFAVTDKLEPTGSRNPYGCCILALSGRQPNLRPGWAGGDRIAIHGSPGNSTGTAASAGCLRARDSDLRVLLRTVVLGTPVVITA